MTQSQIKIDWDVLNKLSTDIEAAHSAVTGAAAAVAQAAVQAETVWTGAAATACQNALSEWNTDLAQVTSGLTELEDAISTAGSSFAAAEAAAAAAAASQS
ncbi:MAG: hypothetical protein JWN95_3654 [Frankiales bacterium]|nr:hypothetical protein [Frankiales bacterium]